MAIAISRIKTDVEIALNRRILSALPATFYDSLFYIMLKAAYDRITDECRIPTSTATITISTPVPTDSQILLPDGSLYSSAPAIWDQANGIQSLEYNDGTDVTPLERKFMKQLQTTYGQYWKAPLELDTAPTWYCEYDDPLKILIIPTLASGSAGKTLKMVYASAVALPTVTTDNLPTEFEEFAHVITEWVVGKCYDVEKEGRGAQKIGMFESYLANRKRKRMREGGSKRTVSQQISRGLNTYHADY